MEYWYVWSLSSCEINQSYVLTIVLAIDTSSATCAFDAGARYCGKLYYGNAAPAVEEDDVLPPRVCSDSFRVSYAI